MFFLGSNASFSAVAVGTAPLSYQWYLNGAPLIDGGRAGGATTTNLNIAECPNQRRRTVSAGCHQQLRRGDQRGGRAFGSIAGRHYQPAGQSACHRRQQCHFHRWRDGLYAAGLPLVFQWRGADQRRSHQRRQFRDVDHRRRSKPTMAEPAIRCRHQQLRLGDQFPWLRSPSMPGFKSPGNRRVRRSCWAATPPSPSLRLAPYWAANGSSTARHCPMAIASAAALHRC